MKSWDIVLYTVFSLSSITACFGGPSFLKQNESYSLQQVSVATKAEGERTVGAVAANTLSIQTVAAADTSSIAGVKVAVQPGTFAFDTELRLEESDALATGLAGANLGVTLSEAAAKAVFVSTASGGSSALAKPMTLSIPLGTTALRLLADDQALVVVFRVKDGDGYLDGVIPNSKLRIVDGNVEFEITTLGAYQPSYIPSTQVEIAEKAPTKASAQRIITKTEMVALPQASLSALSLVATGRTIKVATTLQNGTAKRCFLEVFNVGEAVSNFKDLGAATSYEEDFSHTKAAIMGKARIGCLLSDDRTIMTSFMNFSLPSVPDTPSQPTATAPIFTSISLMGAANDGYINKQENASTLDMAGNLQGANYDTAEYRLVNATADCVAVTGWNGALPKSNSADFEIDGAYKVCVKLSKAGHAAAYGASNSIILDTIVPIVSINTLTSINDANVSNYTISGTCSENGRNVVISNAYTATTSCSSGAWEKTFDASSIPNGSVVFDVHLSDAAGNNASPLSGPTNKLTTSPSVSIDTVTPVNSSNYTYYIVSGGCSHGGEDVEINAFGESRTVMCNIDNWNVDFNLTSHSEGVFSILVSHKGMTKSESVLIDKQLPIITLSGIPSINVSNVDMVQISGTCSTEEEGRYVEIIIEPSTPLNSLQCSNGTFSGPISFIPVPNGIGYQLKAKIVDAAGNVNFSNYSAFDKNIVECGAIGDSCYDDSDAITAGEAITPMGKKLHYTNVGGFQIWKDLMSGNILRANGEDKWAMKLNPSGKGATMNPFLDFTSIKGRACPDNVYLDDSSAANTFSIGNCLYYTEEFDQKLDYAGVTQNPGSMGLAQWNNYNGGDPKWYVGNIETCAAKGMRLPTIYEMASAPGTDSNYPTSDVSPSFSMDGVPAVFGNSTWTATADKNSPSNYLAWDGILLSTFGAETSHALRCVLP